LRYRKPNGSGSSTTGAINVMNGIINSPLNGYYQVKNTVIVNNTLVDCDLGVRIGTSLSGATLAPENLIVANNIMLDCDTNAFQIITSPTGSSSNEGNITQNGSWDLTNGVNSNQTVNSGLLSSGTDFYRITSGSPAIDAGVGSYPFLTKDILYGDREISFDAGAEEFDANGNVGPYKVADVGTSIGFASLNTLSLNDVELQFDMFPNPATNRVSFNIVDDYKLYDMSGRLVKQVRQENHINLDGLESGIYMVNNSNGLSKKLLIK
jgi:poly(beta-D-mannuronate) lyase